MFHQWVTVPPYPWWTSLLPLISPDSAVPVDMYSCLNARGSLQIALTIENAAGRNLRKSSVSAQSNCWNRWLMGLIQPTFSPQEKRIAVWATNPALLINLPSRSAQNCGIPVVPHKTGMALQGLTVHAYRLAPNQVLLLPPQLSIYMVQFSCWIFNLQTRKQSQVLRYNINLSQAQSIQMGYTRKKWSWERCAPFHKVCDLLWPWK